MYLLHFPEEKKAEEESFETEFVAGRLQDELVRMIGCRLVCWMCM